MQYTQRPVRVLIVDDEPDIVAVLCARLNREGSFAIETAADGADALAKVKSFKPDVMLLDLVMPRLDGWEVCRRLRADVETVNLPVIMMTAHAAAVDEARAEKAGLHRVIFKPFDPGRISEMLIRALPQREFRA